MSRTHLGYRDGALFVAAMENAQEECDLEFVQANMPKLESLIAKYQERAYELAQLQYRARMVCEHHGPSADMRGRRP